jgi:Flp pilus assembly pilin Flp
MRSKDTTTSQRRRADVRSDRGAGLAEYGLLLLLIFMACVVIVGTFGQTLAGTFTTIEATLFAN